MKSHVVETVASCKILCKSLQGMQDNGLKLGSPTNPVVETKSPYGEADTEG